MSFTNMDSRSELGTSRRAKVTYYGLTKEEFDERYNKASKPPKVWREKFSDVRRYLHSLCTCTALFHFLEARLPAITVIRTYKFKEYILGDIIAGLSVGVMTIPQGMAYAILASVPAILGLYTCLIPAFVYFIFGTSRHIAMGTMALSSLIIANAVQRGTSHINALIKECDPENSTEIADLTAQLEEKQVTIAVSMTFLAGIILILMSLLRLGFVITYMGDAFVSGYLTAANIRVLTHQAVLCFGIKDHMSHHTGLFNYFYMLYEMAINIKHTNIATLITSLVALGIIISIKYGVNEKFKSKLKVPVPVELIIVIIGIVISHFSKFESRFGVQIVKHVPQGMPKPTLPDPVMMRDYALESTLLGIVSFVFAGMMAKLFCARHSYSVDNNQELFASGMCNAVGGLFSCIGVSVSPPRAFLMEMTGGYTQVAYLVNAVLILLTLFFLAPFLNALPICILACLVITSCIPLFVHYVACITYWKTSKYDFSIWLVAMICTLAIDVDLGMVLGVGYSFIVIIYQSQRPYATSLIRHEEDGMYLDSKNSKCETHNSNIRIFKFESPLYFATLEVFKEKLFSNTVALSALKAAQKSRCENIEEGISLQVTASGDAQADTTINESVTVHTPLTNRKKTLVFGTTQVFSIIVDCSAIPFMDTPGARLLGKLHKEYSALEVNFMLASCTSQMLSIMSRVSECKDVVAEAIYPSIQDAVLNLSSKGKFS